MTARRHRDFVTRTTTARFREAVRDWASGEIPRLPTREYLRSQLEDELDVLIRGLGPWADVDPWEIFPSEEWDWPPWD